MLNCKGVHEFSYRERNGVRVAVSPICHYPDYCPHYKANEVGDCMSQCGNLPTIDRPCFIDATKYMADQYVHEERN